jgi:glycosyltransferase involved in cell wall biosynthesis
MRIAVIGSPWVPTPPPAYGGTEAVVHGLILGLLRAGHDVLYAGHPDSTVPCQRVSPVARDDIGPIGHGTSELAHVIGAYQAAERWGADVVHDHTLTGPVMATGTSDLPVVVTNHGAFERLTLPIFRCMSRALIVAISHSQASTADDVPVAAVVHHGLDVASWPFGRGEGGYALFLGRMHPDKGPHRAIRLAREAGIPIVLAAKMREAAELDFFEQEVRPLLGADATWVGEADATTKRKLLAGASVLLNPISWMEPFGMVMIEALACGTPVVTAPAGAAPEIVDDGETGFLCLEDEEYVEALQAAPGLRREACRAAVCERFTTDLMVRNYLAVYGDAVRESALVG